MISPSLQSFSLYTFFLLGFKPAGFLLVGDRPRKQSRIIAHFNEKSWRAKSRFI